MFYLCGIKSNSIVLYRDHCIIAKEHRRHGVMAFYPS